MAKRRSPSKAASKKRSARASSAKSVASPTGVKSRVKSTPRSARKTGGNGELPSARRKPASATRPPAEPAETEHNGVDRFTETGERLRKTHLTPAELEEFRQLLTAKRQEIIGDMNHLRKEALGHGSSGEGGGGSTMPIHMADIGSDTWEQELTLGLIEKERGLLREIEEALDRVEDKTYGICLGTNKPISKARLRAKPWAKYCIEHARKRELGRF